MEENVNEEVVKEEIVPVDYSELRANKVAEMKEKYHDAIYSLADKYQVDVGVGFNMLEAIAYATIHPQEPMLYECDVELKIEELVEDYQELVYYSDKCREAKGL